MGRGARKSKPCRLKGKPKQRVAKKSVLFYGEGDTEKAFLDYLHGLYSSRKGNKTIHRGAGSGGSHADIIHQALNHNSHSRDFDAIYVLMDDDCKEIGCKEAVGKAKEKLRKNPTRRRVPVWCIYAEPVCIEGVFLNLLEEKVPGTADACKRAFHAKFLSEKEKLNKHSYVRIFPPDFLKVARHNSALLNKIISVFE